MKKTLKIVICACGSVIAVAACVLCIWRFCFGIDLFDRSGWKTTDDGTVYYLDKRGDALTGWLEIDGGKYYFDPAHGGAMVTKWLDTEDGRYYLADDGQMVTGWLTLEDTVYYLDGDGTMITGWFELDGSRRYFGGDGAMQTGWIEAENARYYLDENGVMATGWLDTEDGRYYLDEDGVMVTGWLDAEEGRYYLNENGNPVSGWLDTEDGRYYLDENGVVTTGWLELSGSRYFLAEDGKMVTNWLDTADGRYYFGEDGAMKTGWITADDARYYLAQDGKMATGWLEYENDRYYLLGNGTMAVGEVVIDGVSNFFTSQGKYVLLVNRWNPVPDGYAPNLVAYRGHKIDAVCVDSLTALVQACNDAGYSCSLDSLYRSYELQQTLFTRRYNSRLSEGYSEEEAYELVALGTAIPGTSEHQLGLAVDLGGSDRMHAWLREHSWEYGFIVRYPDGKTDHTGIKYEPWHVRYVGKELAKELYELDLCMEEYMEMLTEIS